MVGPRPRRRTVIDRMAGVPLLTPFTDMMGIEVPVVLAPMGGLAGGALAAAVSNGGGLGLVGGGREERDWLQRELTLVTAMTDKPWGIGFLSWAASRDSVELALGYRPHAVMLSFGDPTHLAELVADSSIRLIIQVTNLYETRQAADLGADVIVVQGTEAGGHSGTRATLPFVPIVVDMVSPTPVLAAGGIADGRGLAAALCLGAAGALLGTRFEASAETLLDAESVKAILDGRGDDTERNRVFDIARGAPWPSRYLARTLRNDFLDRWRGREAELDADEAAKAEYAVAAEERDMSVLPVWASEAIDLITTLSPAAELVAQLSREAEEALLRAGGALVAH
jgi:nitronate monooxygenase